MVVPVWFKPVLIAAVLALLWVLEGLWPMFGWRPHRWRHDAANLALGLLNAAVVSLLFASLLAADAAWAEQNRFGLLRLLRMPAWLNWTLAIVLFDLWMYLWHVANHKTPILWRFHQVHHADRELDATSALRFHTGEIVLSSITRLAVLPLLGMTLAQLLVYELILQPIILLHHSNVRFPAGLDRVLRLVIVTPRIHWVHHSKLRIETDSNYSSVLNGWDRLFRTLRWKKPQEIEWGLDYTGEQESNELGGILGLPLRKFTTPRKPF